MTPDGNRAMPFWSLRSRAERIIATVPGYAGFVPVEIALAEFRAQWLPRMESDGLRVGVNWSGPRATGYDLEPSALEQNLAAAERTRLRSEPNGQPPATEGTMRTSAAAGTGVSNPASRRASSPST